MAYKAMVIAGVLVAVFACVTLALPAPGEYDVVEAYPVVEERGDIGYAAPTQGWGWSAPVSGWSGWKPRIKYLKFAIPIPQLPRIRFGIKGGLRLHASVHHDHHHHH